MIESREMVVVFIDECYLLGGDVCGYVWGETNARIEVPIKNEKERMRSGRVPRPWKRTKHRQTYFGALNYQTKEFIIEAYPADNGESTVKFIKNLQCRYQHKKIALIWDGATTGLANFENIWLK